MFLDYFDTVFAFAVVMLVLSLVITALVQIVVAVTGLRGRNLLWAVQRLLEQAPDLKGNKKSIAVHAVTHAAVSGRLSIITRWVLKRPRLAKAWSRMNLWGRATAIGSDELMKVLADLSNGSDASLPDSDKEALTKWLKKLVPPETVQHGRELADEFERLFPSDAGKMKQTLRLVEKKASRAAGEMGAWFDTVMSRSTDRFIRRTRFVTVVFAVILAFWLQIDSLALIRQLSTDDALRASLVQAANQTLERAGSLLTSEPVAVSALKELQGEFPDGGAEIPTTLATEAQGKAWLQGTFTGSPDLEALIEKYGEMFQVLTRAKLGELASQTQELRGDLETSGLELLSLDDLAWNPIKQYNKAEQVGGVVISIFLLSFGAPFWFNALRGLSTLRPVLAGKVDPSESDK